MSSIKFVTLSIGLEFVKPAHFSGGSFSFKNDSTSKKATSSEQYADRAILRIPADSRQKSFHRRVSDNGLIFIVFGFIMCELDQKKKSRQVIFPGGFSVCICCQ